MLAALAFLTPLPVGARRPGPATLVWLPFAGAVIGAVVAGTWVLASEVWPPLLAAVVVVAIDLAITGALHVDGLADTADGILPPLDGPERRRAVMAAPDVGAFGVAAVVAVLLLRAAALAAVGAVDPEPLALVALWSLGRGLMSVALVAGPYVGGGLGSAFLGARLPAVLAAAVLAPAPFAVLADAPARTGGSLLVAALVAGAVVVLARRRLDGVTGDVVGAAGLLAETAGLLVLAGSW